MLYSSANHNTRPMREANRTRYGSQLACGLLLIQAMLLGGCDAFTASSAAPLFTVPLEVEGRAVTSAIIDTGGSYEVLLRSSFGLEVVGEIDVLAFGGMETVRQTVPFTYLAGGVETTADSAIIGLSACDCNGLGFPFFRKTGVVLGLDFTIPRASFLITMPPVDGLIAFRDPPERLSTFRGAFIEVEITAGGESRRVLGLLDTGAPATVMRRGLVGQPGLLSPNRLIVLINHDTLGTLGTRVGLFDTDALPDIILGMDVMRAWADEWYFTFTEDGGRIGAVGLNAVMGPLAEQLSR